MRKLMLLAMAAFCSAFVVYIFTGASKPSRIVAGSQIKHKKVRVVLSCAPNRDAIDFDDPANDIPLLGGWGKYRMAVTVNDDSANIYFQQGINLYYGFHIIEALASFNKALKFDDQFAMGYWAQALAYGPNINDIGYAASPEALVATKKAKALSGKCTALEKALINAMQVRYSTDSTAKRDELNQLYADAMKKVHTSFSASPDAAALYADALMLQHPWDLYDSAYNPKPWTPQIVRVLEQLVKQYPANPGANHYYIHAIEGSAHPEKGLVVANRLGAMMPGVSHLVHMPSHIYIRTGNYNTGIKVNDDAIKGYADYLSKFPPAVNNAFLYQLHNQHMQVACAGMGAQNAVAVRASADLRSAIDTSFLAIPGYLGISVQYGYMSPVFTAIRFGKWNDVLTEPALPEQYVYAGIIRHFARGLAFARKKDIEKAAAELQMINAVTGNPQLQEHPPAFNPGIAAVKVAYNILSGVVAEENGELQAAIERFKKAVADEDVMLYNEPKDWLLPARQYLGNALLKNKQYGEAEKIYRHDLTVNPKNPWSLTGLVTSLEKQHKKTEAKLAKQLLQNAIKEADIKIETSVF